jgi:hypothetical protein
MMRPRRAPLGLALAALALALGSGCTTVRPWERELLARPEMSFEPDGLEARRRDHVYTSKEASLPGGGTGGGGCGCN